MYGHWTKHKAEAWRLAYDALGHVKSIHVSPMRERSIKRLELALKAIDAIGGKHDTAPEFAGQEQRSRAKRNRKPL